ncbi:hypothetical protein GKZ90_0014415 [Flavobacterium sp. MC2016-06]|jgi:hypothetical protein|uniref:hypothetical protein n=1 Tax=Flavobacterium sp. MC2016-06 TaxID=2676308 RepID=UPI0012BACAF4|nr:hypothetical protein [Flavobacterium sp. MC2016-06]MBU3859212.1 hypothetical protein [Flavobacterium sp. MC2016-06]
MNYSENHIFTYIVEFRGGTYCTQVHAENVEASISKWLDNIKKEKNEIMFLGDKTIHALECQINSPIYPPTQLDRLKNIWFLSLNSKSGSFSINIVKTSNS